MSVSFEVGLLPQRPAAETAELAARAEELGFQGVWVADSQSVFREAFVTLALCAAKTRSLRLATGVTNPVTRHPAVVAAAIATLDELAGGRAVLGLGVGESAVRTLGLPAARLRDLEEATRAIRAWLAGRPASYRGKETRLMWTRKTVPIYFASSGPKSLQLAGQIADGVLFQVGADPRLIRYAVERVRAGAAQAGRPLNEVKLYARLACSVAGDRRRAREDIKSYAATAAGTVFASLPARDMPPDLRGEIQEMKARYDYHQHADPRARHRELVTDRILDAMAVAGTPEEAVPRLRQIIELGIDGFVLPLAGSDPGGALETLAASILSRLR